MLGPFTLSIISWTFGCVGPCEFLLLHLSYGICVIFVMCCGDATCITMRNIDFKRCLLLRAIVGFSRSVDHTTSLDCIEGT
jgi:hypothetical protein